MKTTTPQSTSQPVKAEVERLADFVLFAQRSCILNLSPTLNRENLSYPQFFLLACLTKEEYLTMSDVAAKFGHSTAAATGQIDRLEQLEFVKRVHAASDRRKIMVSITEQGRELVARMRQRLASELSRILAGMDDDASYLSGHAPVEAPKRLVA